MGNSKKKMDIISGADSFVIAAILWVGHVGK
jgi:hypothetical protein